MRDTMKLVYLEWEDATAQAGWYTKTKMAKWAKEANMTISQVGWIYEENKTHIVIVCRLSLDDEGIGMYGNLQKIPKTWIRKRIDLSKHIK